MRESSVLLADGNSGLVHWCNDGFQWCYPKRWFIPPSGVVGGGIYTPLPQIPEHLYTSTKFIKKDLTGSGRKCTLPLLYNRTKRMEEQEVKMKMALSYFAGMVDSGCTLGYVKTGKKQKEVPMVRIRRGHEYALTRIKASWGGSIIKRGDSAFELTLTHGKAIAFLTAIKGNVIARYKEVAVVLDRYQTEQAAKKF